MIQNERKMIVDKTFYFSRCYIVF